jgi:hypothetical protein
VGTQLRATATDPDGTIAGVQFFVDGVKQGSVVTTFPYQVQWVPTAEGVYRITAVATDNVGLTGTSGTSIVIATPTGGDVVATGTYQGLATGGGLESGNFAIITATGKTGTFIGYSTTPGLDRIYFIPGIPVNGAGGYTLTDASNHVVIAGTASETGTNGTLDSGRLTFIGVNTNFLQTGTNINSAYYSGSIAGRPASKLAAILGADGSIIIYVADGSFVDAGGGGISGTVDATGAFSVVTLHGNRFVGRIDPITRILSGSLSGANGGTFLVGPTTLALTSNVKIAGTAVEVGSNIVHPATGNTYDQVLLQGNSATITADPNQIVRTSFVDVDGDIVQVEFSGAGTLSLRLDPVSGPSLATNYNQPGVAYMKGNASIVVTGADETSNLSIFSVGRANAVNQALFRDGVSYGGVADIASVVIVSPDGKFGGLRAGNVNFVATKGLAGVCAPGVQFYGPVYVGNITAADTASPMLLVGSASEVRITGGDLWQANSQPVQVGGFLQLAFTDGMTSQGVLLPARLNQGRLQQNGLDVGTLFVVGPTR